MPPHVIVLPYLPLVFIVWFIFIPKWYLLYQRVCCISILESVVSRIPWFGLCWYILARW